MRERLEQAYARGLVHADPAVADGDADQHSAADLRTAGGADADESVIGEFDGVADQVEQDLSHPHRVASHPVRAARGRIDEQRQILSHGLRPHRLDRSIDQFAQAEGQPFDVHPPGVDLGEVQDVVDDAQQGLSALAHHGDTARLRRIQPRAFKHLHHPEHPVHRRPDLMAHRGEEGGLRPVCRLGLRPRGLGQVPLALGGLAGGLKLLEQPNVLDRDHRLVGESRDQLDLPIGERLNLRPPQPDHADRHALAQQRHAQHGADLTQPRIGLLRVDVFAPRVHDLHRPPLQRRAADDGARPGLNGLPPFQRLVLRRQAVTDVEAVGAVLITEKYRHLRPAQRGRICDHRQQHAAEVECRAADDAQDLAGRDRDTLAPPAARAACPLRPRSPTGRPGPRRRDQAPSQPGLLRLSTPRVIAGFRRAMIAQDRPVCRVCRVPPCPAAASL